jgi:hypothetical protein
MRMRRLASPSASERAAQWLENGCRGRLDPAAAQILNQHELTRYGSLDGDSGVIAYQIGDDWIKLEFPGKLYLYNHSSAGIDKIEPMKDRARAGRGLASYVSRHVREGYAFRLPWPPVSAIRLAKRPASHAASRLRR